MRKIIADWFHAPLSLLYVYSGMFAFFVLLRLTMSLQEVVRPLTFIKVSLSRGWRCVGLAATAIRVHRMLYCLCVLAALYLVVFSGRATVGSAAGTLFVDDRSNIQHYCAVEMISSTLAWINLCALM